MSSHATAEVHGFEAAGPSNRDDGRWPEPEGEEGSQTAVLETVNHRRDATPLRQRAGSAIVCSMKSHRRTARTNAIERRKHRTRVKGVHRFILVVVLLVPLLLALVVAGVVLFGMRAASRSGRGRAPTGQAEGRQPGRDLPHLRGRRHPAGLPPRRGEPDRDRSGAHPADHEGRHRGHRGPALLRAPGCGLRGDRPSGLQGPAGGQDRGRLLHHHHAAGGQPLPGPQQHLLHAQVPGSGPRLADGERDVQGRHPGPLPQHHLLRRQRVRRRGGRSDVLRQRPRSAHASRSRPAGRPSPGPQRLLAAPPPGGRPQPARRGASEHVRIRFRQP